MPSLYLMISSPISVSCFIYFAQFSDISLERRTGNLREGVGSGITPP